MLAMRKKDIWIPLPKYIEAPEKRSLSLLFILTELIVCLDIIQEDLSTCANNQKLRDFSSQNKTFLDKLCFYCDILIQASREDGYPVLRRLDQMQAILSQFRSKTISIKKNIASEEISQLLQYTYAELKILFFDLVPFFHETKTDENLLLFFLEKRKSLNCHLGVLAIEKLLQNLFPGGFSHLQAIIHEGFTRRGFTQFLSEKEFLLEENFWGAK